MILESDFWETPDEVLDNMFELLSELGICDREKFDIDVCANEHNAKVDLFIDEQMNALANDWAIRDNTLAWCNPPYSRGNVDKFVDKAIEQMDKGVITVMLLNTDNSTKWFNRIVSHASHIVMITSGRIRFVNKKTGKSGGTPLKPNMIAIFSKRKADEEVKTLYVHYRDLVN